MSNIYSILGLPDTDRSFVNTVGQSVVYGALQEAVRQMNEEIDQAIGIFVEGTTEGFKERYKLSGGGYMQRRGRQAPPGAVKVVGYWDVAYPLEDFSDGIAVDDVSLAYMTMQELDLHLDSIQQRNLNTIRREILVALLGNTNYSFIDEIHGTLTVVPLANGDTVLYPPILGADAEATEDHYVETNYAVASISATNDPCASAVDELEEHFGVKTGGDELVMFVGATLGAKISSTLTTSFYDVEDLHLQMGADSDTVVNLPANLPGKVLGRHSDGIWVVEWRVMPDNYSLSLHLNAPKPLKRRVDPADTGLGQGLQLVATNDKFPLQESFYRNRYGFGVGNRLNGLVQEFGTGGDYTIPTAYAR